MKKTSSISLIAILFTTSIAAQFRLPSNTLQQEVQMIVAAYHKNFENYFGAVINQQPQSIEYTTSLTINQAQQCTITEYSATRKPEYSWRELVKTTEDFNTAARKYKELYIKLKGMNPYPNNNRMLEGELTPPDESRKFWSTLLTVTEAPQPVKMLAVEILIQYEFPEWKVRLLVYEKQIENDKELKQTEPEEEDVMPI